MSFNEAALARLVEKGKESTVGDSVEQGLEDLRIKDLIRGLEAQAGTARALLMRAQHESRETAGRLEARIVELEEECRRLQHDVDRVTAQAAEAEVRSAALEAKLDEATAVGKAERQLAPQASSAPWKRALHRVAR